jgi:hypothetical protein
MGVSTSHSPMGLPGLLQGLSLLFCVYYDYCYFVIGLWAVIVLVLVLIVAVQWYHTCFLFRRSQIHILAYPDWYFSMFSSTLQWNIGSNGSYINHIRLFAVLWLLRTSLEEPNILIRLEVRRAEKLGSIPRKGNISSSTAPDRLWCPTL